MKDTTCPLGEYVSLIVESTTDIKAWVPVLIEMLKKEINVIEVLSPVKFNDDCTDIVWGTADQSRCGLQIYVTVQELKDHLDFFAERIRRGDIISVWESVSELEDLIDELAEMNAPGQHPEKEIERTLIEGKISDEIKSSSPEELAAELTSFAKKEFPDLGYESRIPIHRITGLFWRFKNIIKWALPADVGLKIEKAEILAQKHLESEREAKEKEILSSLVNPCIVWTKEHGLKKVTEAYVDAFLLERNITALTRTKKRSLYALVNTKLDEEKPDFLSLVNSCVDWIEEHGLQKVTEADIDAFLLEKNINALLRTEKRELYAMVKSTMKSKQRFCGNGSEKILDENPE